MIDDRHKVNLGSPDKVILVDMYQVGVVASSFVHALAHLFYVSGSRHATPTKTS